MNIGPGHVHPILWEKLALIRDRVQNDAQLASLAPRLADTGDRGLHPDLRRRLTVQLLLWEADARFEHECAQLHRRAHLGKNAAGNWTPAAAEEAGARIYATNLAKLTERRVWATSAIEAWLADPAAIPGPHPDPAARSNHLTAAAAICDEGLGFIGMPPGPVPAQVEFLHRLADEYDLLVGRNSPFHALDVAADLAAGPRDVDPAGAALAIEIEDSIEIGQAE